MVVVLTTKALAAISLTLTPYEVAPTDALQIKVTVELLVVGPGLMVLPGVGFVGMVGAAIAVPHASVNKTSSQLKIFPDLVLFISSSPIVKNRYVTS